MRPTRQVFKELVSAIDTLIPSNFRTSRCHNGAGARSLGIAGRSVHDVLSDVVRVVAARRAELDCRRILRSRGALLFEVEMPGWIITGMSPGGELFLKDAPWGSMEGLGPSLADFVHMEDLDALHALCPNTTKTTAANASVGPQSGVNWSNSSAFDVISGHCRLMHFSACSETVHDTKRRRLDERNKIHRVNEYHLEPNNPLNTITIKSEPDVRKNKRKNPEAIDPREVSPHRSTCAQGNCSLLQCFKAAYTSSLGPHTLAAEGLIH